MANCQRLRWGQGFYYERKRRWNDLQNASDSGWDVPTTGAEVCAPRGHYRVDPPGVGREPWRWLMLRYWSVFRWYFPLFRSTGTMGVNERPGKPRKTSENGSRIVTVTEDPPEDLAEPETSASEVVSKHFDKPEDFGEGYCGSMMKIQL